LHNEQIVLIDEYNEDQVKESIKKMNMFLTKSKNKKEKNQDKE
jgi:hypothetical protein